MEPEPISKSTIAFGLSLALCSVVNALLVVIKEKSPAVAADMKALSGHHWVTHVLVIVILFFLCGGLFSLLNGGQGPRLSARRLTGTVAGGVVLGALIILGFYLIAD